MCTRLSCDSCSVISDSLQPHGLYGPWNSAGQNTGVGRLFLLQRIFPTQGSNPGLLHYRQILYQLSHKGNPRRLEGVAYPFSRGCSQPKNRTRVSCIAGKFFTNWAIREAQIKQPKYLLTWSFRVLIKSINMEDPLHPLNLLVTDYACMLSHLCHALLFVTS